MDDVIFLGLLKQKKLFYGNLYSDVLEEKTTIRKAILFLDRAIERSMNVDEFVPLYQLLVVMSDECLNYYTLNQLAQEMKKGLETSLTSMQEIG